MSTREKAEALVAKAKALIAQHEKLFAEHGMPLDVADRILAHEDLGEEARKRLEQELAASREAVRREEFATAREVRKSRKPRGGHDMI
jgi:hypothetical protein